MSSLYETISTLCEQKGVSGYRMCRDIGIQPSIVTDLKSGRKKGLSADTAQKIADYFGITVRELIGERSIFVCDKAPLLQAITKALEDEEAKKDPAKTGEVREVTDADIKFALFGGDKDIPDEAFEDVKRYAEFIKSKYKANL